MKRLLYILFASMVILTVPACNGKKKLAEQEALLKQQRKEEALKKLNSMLGENTMTLQEKENELAEIKSWNLDDSEVNDLIMKVEQKLMEERRQKELQDEKERIEKEKEANRTKLISDTKQALTAYFKQIAQAGDMNAANQLISEALTLFESEQTPVLIVIHKNEGLKDYDKPTTIKRYLELIKDQKKYSANFENIIFSSNNKISELELLK